MPLGLELALRLTLLLGVPVACQDKSVPSRDTPTTSAPSHDTPSPSTPMTPSSSGVVQKPVPCEKDSDCRSPACGPCTPGAPLLEPTPACFVNPCPNVKVACSAQKNCVVR
jgi:hypothetical protein